MLGMLFRSARIRLLLRSGTPTPLCRLVAVQGADEAKSRQLLTHTSGFSYGFKEPILQQWRKSQPQAQRQSFTTLRSRFLHPLLSEPGANWSYGPSVDWAGVVVERLTQITLQEYIRQHI
jgi:CubicO group peptidase (beta-lactamase class C family)